MSRNKFKGLFSLPTYWKIRHRTALEF